MPLTRNWVPRFVRDQQRAGCFQGNFLAATLYADISGFTALTENLMLQGKEGAEILSEQLNQIFAPLTQTIHAHHGWIATFMGDSFLAVFPDETNNPWIHSVQTALAIRKLFHERTILQTQSGAFTLNAGMGLAWGRVRWSILGQKSAPERLTCCFHGNTIEKCLEAERYACAGEITVTESLMLMIEDQVEAVAFPEKTDFWHLTGRIHEPTRHQSINVAQAPPIPSLIKGGEASQILTPLDMGGQEGILHNAPSLEDHLQQDQTPFVPQSVWDANVVGEFRQITTLFILFKAPSSFKRLNGFVSGVLKQAEEYGGYFNKLDFGDKGCLMLILFGAPVAHENDPERAAGFLAALRRDPPVPTVQWKAGLTCGTVYAGLVGSIERGEYTAIGDQVNLAARLVQHAKWGEIWINAPASESLRKNWQVDSLGKRHFKGKLKPQPVYRLANRKTVSGADFYSGEIVGRERELARLQAEIDPIFHGQFGGMTILYGEPGQGKSRLLYELQKSLSETRQVTWLVGRADQTLRQPLNLFRSLAASYFEQSPNLGLVENRRRFEQKIEALFTSLPSAKVAEFKDERERLRFALGNWLELDISNPWHERMSAQLRFENILYAFKTLVQIESIRRPVVLQLEDLHWIDIDSIQLLRVLTRNATALPFGILCTSRYRDDGSRPELELDTGVIQCQIELGYLDHQEIAKMARQWLGGEVTPALDDFLVSKTGGNPFFIEQILLDLRERGLLSQNRTAKWDLPVEQVTEVPASINAVLVARLDRLAAEVKRVVQTAAVLGHDFEVLILMRMLPEDENVWARIHEAEEQAIWSAMEEWHYVFRHALLRDTVYEMQLRAHLRELHLLAAESIEQVYANTPRALAAQAASLAYHYAQAGNIERERYYSGLAGQQAAAQFANQKAIAYLTRALELTPPGDIEGRYRLLLSHEEVCSLHGLRDAQLADLNELTALTKTLNHVDYQAEVSLRRSSYDYLIGNYSAAISFAIQAAELAQSSGNLAIETRAQLYSGRPLLRKSDFEGARVYLEKALTLARQAGLSGLEAEGMNYLGSLHYYLSDYVSAQTHYQGCLQLHRHNQDRLGEGKTLGNLGLIAYDRGDYVAASEKYEEALQIFREIGCRDQQAWILNNLGMVASDQGYYLDASRAYQQALVLSRETGSRWEESNTLSNIGIVYWSLGEYDLARENYSEATRIKQEIDDQHGIGLVLAFEALLQYTLQDYEPAQSNAEHALAIALETKDQLTEAYAQTYLGHIFLARGDLEKAHRAYQQAHNLWQKLGQIETSLEPLGGLARLALHQGDRDAARQYVETILATLRQGAILDLFGLCLTCFEVLSACQSSRALSVLKWTYDQLQTRASWISEESLRRSFLEKVPAHRRLVKEYGFSQ
jgi:class 3 adenylate cyclase/tetratricopeptide (TPR) repeat protein